MVGVVFILIVYVIPRGVVGLVEDAVRKQAGAKARDYTAQGKDRLQKRLTAAINKVLTEEEGFGGVDQVYFKSFLVQ